MHTCVPVCDETVSYRAVSALSVCDVLRHCISFRRCRWGGQVPAGPLAAAPAFRTTLMRAGPRASGRKGDFHGCENYPKIVSQSQIVSVLSRSMLLLLIRSTLQLCIC